MWCCLKNRHRVANRYNDLVLNKVIAKMEEKKPNKSIGALVIKAVGKPESIVDIRKKFMRKKFIQTIQKIRNQRKNGEVWKTTNFSN